MFSGTPNFVLTENVNVFDLKFVKITSLESINVYMLANPAMLVVGLASWQGAYCTFRTSRVEDFSPFTCR